MTILRHLRNGRMKQTLVMLLIVMVVLVAASSMAEACPQCKKALASSNGGTQGNIVRGYFWSILFMLSMPFVIFGSFCTYMYLEVRKARRKQAAAQSTVADAATALDATGAYDARRVVETHERETVEV